VLSTLKRRVAPHLPVPVRGWLRTVRKQARSAGYKARKRSGGDSVTRDDVVEALRAVGLGAGDGVFVHSSLSRLGHVEGGSATVLEALDEVLGPEGLVAMPAFPLVGGTVEFLSTDPVFDVRSTPSTMGALTEEFRNLPGTSRSLHPTHSVAARGPGGGELVRGHAQAPTPFGDGTPFARMIDRGMHQVWIGVGLPIFTLYHAFECRRPGGFPIEVFLPEPMNARCVDEHGEELVVATLVHDPVVGRQKDPTRKRLRDRLVAAGVLHVAPLGRGEVMAARMPELMDELERALRDGLTIYDIDLGRAPSTT
jgi:aminoglycoside N3'-acetyltransferase